MYLVSLATTATTDKLHLFSPILLMAHKHIFRHYEEERYKYVMYVLYRISLDVFISSCVSLLKSKTLFIVLLLIVNAVPVVYSSTVL